MKSKLLSLALCCGLAHAQGTLTPPGAPAPTMKTLDQVEPRRPLVVGTLGVTIASPSGQITISQPGSYYLTGNLTVNGSDGIQINSSQVTLDLMGYTIRSIAAPGVLYGIMIGEVNNISISNGVIAGGTSFSGGEFTPSTGFNRGVSSPSSATNVRLSDLSINRMQGDGINITNSSFVKNCVVFICGGYGIFAGNVTDCMVETTGVTGISASMVSNSRVLNAGSTGIDAFQVTDSRSSSREASGINATIVENSRGVAQSTSTGSGISATKTSNSIGEVFATTGTGIGISSTVLTDSFGTSEASHGISGDVISNSRGRSNGVGSGIRGETVSNSYGYADPSALHGIDADIVTNSIGRRETSVGSKFGISANRGNFCKVFNGEDILFKYNMP
ncbi:MAG: hypothetical protein EAZ42_11395 [Verrucomicrobia bacterium]|nr:MAG: hypothetical protein EAZ42_11395 [Verrucomicrobiota bacterium]